MIDLHQSISTLSSRRRTMPGGSADPTLLGRGPGGRVLCRWCARELPPGRRRTFCSESCVHAWRLRTSASYLRQQVFLRDQGICARCTVDAPAAYRKIRRARGHCRRQMLQVWGLHRLTRRTLWDADHILPVVEGGGECDLANLRTLCIHCHRLATAALRERLHAERQAVVALVG